MRHKPSTRRRKVRGIRGIGGIRSFRAENSGGTARIDLLRRLVLPDLADPAMNDRDSVRANVDRLARALRAERNRGRAGHWTYDLNRHLALSRALSEETRRMRRLETAKPPRAMTAAETAPLKGKSD